MKPKTPPIDYSAWGNRFDYTPRYNSFKAFCYIKRIGNLVIATEAHNNTGMSITNAAEEVAWLVCRQYQIEPAALIWIEHYIDKPDTFDRVEFVQRGETFTEARWRSMKKELVDLIIADARRATA